MNKYERNLVLLLRISGVVMLMAIPAVVMPRAWMAAIHAWLGLGAFPEGPLVDYLARSISAIYAIQGALLLVVSRNIKRFAPVIRFLACAGVIFGAAMLPIDLVIGMPAYWTAVEGPLIIAGSLLFLYLLRRTKPRRSISIV